MLRRQGDVAKVKEMLEADPLLAQSKDQNGLSVVLKATYYGKRDVVEALLASGVQLNIFEAAATGQTIVSAPCSKKIRHLCSPTRPMVSHH